MEPDTILILVTLVASIVGTIASLYRLDYAIRQYNIAVQTLKESRKYWRKRLKLDKKEGNP